MSNSQHGKSKGQEKTPAEVNGKKPAESQVIKSAENNENKSVEGVGKKQLDASAIFLLENTFPSAANLFADSVPFEKAKDNALIVLDTNVLLLPYGISKHSLDSIKSTYTRLIKNDRLWIPDRVAREFVKNRPAKIQELYLAFNRRKGPSFNKDSRPMIERIEKFKEIKSIEEKFNKLAEEHKAAVSGVLEEIKSWQWDDPVTLLYKALGFKDIIVEIIDDRAEIHKEHSSRFANGTPPGYKDSAKEDQGIGDYLIWRAICQLGESKKKNLIFVTGEEKSDWWLVSEGQCLYPRFELVDEYSRKSGGGSFHIIRFSGLLELFGADSDSIQEIRENERNTLAREPDVSANISANSDVEKWQLMLEEAQKRESAVVSALASLPPETPNDSLAVPLPRVWHRLQHDLVTARNTAAEIKARLEQASFAKKYTGVPCRRCLNLTMGSGGFSNLCGNCGLIESD